MKIKITDKEIKEHEKLIKPFDKHINVPLFQKYLNLRAANLYEHFLKMTYCWLTLWKFSLEDEKDKLYPPQEDFTRIGLTCLSCSKLSKKRYALIDEAANYFFNNDIKRIMEHRLKRLQNFYKKETQEQQLKHLYFPNDPQKEMAVVFYFDNTGKNTHVEIDKKAKNEFLRCALECRLLSIIYENFNLFQNKLKRRAWHLLFNLEYLTNDVIAACHELIGYWEFKHARIKASSLGGSAEKYLHGIYLAIEQALQDRPKASAALLWKHFNTKHTGEENALAVNGYNVYCYDNLTGKITENLICQDDENEKPKSIKYEAFKKYVYRIRQNKPVIKIPKGFVLHRDNPT